MIVANPVSELLARALDNAALRQAVHTSNIANAGVEGFRRLDVSFESELARASSTLGEDLPSAGSLAQPQVVQTNDAVRLDREMALMAKDAVHYQALLNAVDSSFSLLRLAVREGKDG
ncbi:MAG: flagellar basal body protein [Gammaproteobacteria bacterium]